MPVMAYSPIEQGRLPRSRALTTVAERHGTTPYAVALAWTVREPGVLSIPKTGRPERLEANLAALTLELTPEDLALIDDEFPPPRRKRALEML